MKEFIEFLLKQFVNHPEAVQVTESMDGDFHIMNVKVADEDMGMVIGKEGKTINSLRNLVRAKAIKDNVMVRVVLEDNKQQQMEPAPEMTDAQA
jgi:uncharacterized protein